MLDSVTVVLQGGAELEGQGSNEKAHKHLTLSKSVRSVLYTIHGYASHKPWDRFLGQRALQECRKDLVAILK
jgi:hypothetical protein